MAMPPHALTFSCQIRQLRVVLADELQGPCNLRTVVKVKWGRCHGCWGCDCFEGDAALRQSIIAPALRDVQTAAAAQDVQLHSR